MRCSYAGLDVDYKQEMILANTTNAYPFLIERYRRQVSIARLSLLRNHCFLAMGFPHFFYRQGINRLLRKKGFTARPVPV